MKIFVWQGDEVLRDYTSGLVVVAGKDAAEAWSKLSEKDFDAYWSLKTGRHPYVRGDSEKIQAAIERDTEKHGGPDNPEDGFPIHPIGYAPDELPVLVQWGGS